MPVTSFFFVFLAVCSTAFFIFSKVVLAFLSSVVCGPSIDNFVASFEPPMIRLLDILVFIVELVA